MKEMKIVTQTEKENPVFDHVSIQYILIKQLVYARDSARS